MKNRARHALVSSDEKEEERVEEKNEKGHEERKGERKKGHEERKVERKKGHEERKGESEKESIQDWSCICEKDALYRTYIELKKHFFTAPIHRDAMRKQAIEGLLRRENVLENDHKCMWGRVIPLDVLLRMSAARVSEEAVEVAEVRKVGDKKKKRKREKEESIDDVIESDEDVADMKDPRKLVECKCSRSGTVLLFYLYTPMVLNVITAAKMQLDLCVRFRLSGKIRIAKEGINATVAGDDAGVDEYCRETGKMLLRDDIHWKKR